VLIDKTISAAKEFGYNKIVLAGGVSANSELRTRFENECNALGYSLYYPPLKYCGDNAAMVGAQAIHEYNDNNIGDTSLNATATLPINYR
jgi:N6-L-threonylcarbamoyladenine synthase